MDRMVRGSSSLLGRIEKPPLTLEFPRVRWTQLSRDEPALSHEPWKLEVRLTKHSGRADGRDELRKLTTAMKDALDIRDGSSLSVERLGSVLVVYADTNQHLEMARRELDVVLTAASWTAIVTVAHDRGRRGDWQITAGPYPAPRTRHAGRRHAKQQAPLLSRKAKRRWLIASALAAAIGAAFYVTAPGVASTQIGLPLCLPLLCIALVWIHRRIPIALQWTLAVPLAIAGPVCYVLFNGSQLWAWGQLAVFPLLGLVFDRWFIKKGISPRSTPWYGGQMQGPLGPP